MGKSDRSADASRVTITYSFLPSHESVKGVVNTPSLKISGDGYYKAGTVIQADFFWYCLIIGRDALSKPIEACLACLFFYGRSILKHRIWIALISIYLIWGSTYLAIRFAVESIPPFLMASTRFIIPGLILYGWRRIAGDKAPTFREWKSTAIIGLLLLLGGNGAVTWAEQIIPSGIAAMVIGSVPLWIIILNLFTKEGKHQDKKVIISALFGFIGIILLVGPTQFLGITERIRPIGIAVIIFAAIFWSVGSLYSRNAKIPESPLLSTGMEFIAGGIGLLFAGTITGEFSQLDINLITPRSFLSLIYLITFGSLIGFTAYTWLLRNAPISLVSTYAYVNPLIAIILGYIFAEETLNFRIIIAGIIIITSVIFINHSSRINREQVKTLT